MTRRTFAGALAGAALSRSQQVRQRTFAFHNGFWLNLHLELYNLAAGRKQGRNPNPGGLSPEDAGRWSRCIDFYETNVIMREFGDLEMIGANGALCSAGAAARLSARPELARFLPSLEAAAPIYRQHWWTDRQRHNQEWADRAAALIAVHEAGLRADLARAYQGKWPHRPMEAEVSYYLTGASAYTSLRPTRITVSSWSKRNEGDAALETMFHEAGHGLIWKVQRGIGAAEAKLGRRARHPDLWHALLFYTTGELVRRRLPSLEPYAVKYGMWDNTWPGLLAAVKQYWQPYLDGQADFREAITRVVKCDTTM
jgi:hypothetical protein